MKEPTRPDGPRRRSALRAAGAVGAALALGATSPAVAREPAARTHVVEMRGMQFAPAHVSAQRGDSVVWVNRDPVPHNVSGPWNSGTVAAGARWKAAAGGGGAYECTLHPGMRGHVAVE